MIKRDAEKTLLRLASQFPVIGVTGPRQSGKTTLARMAFPEKKYVTFDDVSFRDLAAESPMDFIKAFPSGAIIDEAQKVPGIFDAVKYVVDNGDYTPGKYILTGSSQFRLRENMTDSLAGRAAFVKLLPLATSELRSAGMLPEDPYELIYKGQYPPLYDAEKHFYTEDWYESYIDSYLDLDVKDMINPSNLSTFRKFVQVCAVHSGQILSMDNIARSVGVSAPTIKSWLSILETSYIIHFLEADSNNLGKTIIKAPKLYFVDSGLLCHLLRMEGKEDLILNRAKGAAVETFAIAELMKARTNQGKKPNLTYYRDKNGFEVDVVADWKHTFAIEVKASANAQIKQGSKTRRYLDARGTQNAKSKVMYLGDTSVTVGDTEYVSWNDWCDLS